jgi:hypothetical protein
VSPEAELTRNALMYFVLPVWLAAGFADWMCHRASRIEITSGPKESLIHLLMFVEVAIPITAAMSFEINSLVILVMIVFWAVHEATAVWEVSYAADKREVTPIEQYVHSYLGVLPLMSLLLVVVLNWSQFLALFGLGNEALPLSTRTRLCRGAMCRPFWSPCFYSKPCPTWRTSFADCVPIMAGSCHQESWSFLALRARPKPRF